MRNLVNAQVRLQYSDSPVAARWLPGGCTDLAALGLSAAEKRSRLGCTPFQFAVLTAYWAHGIAPHRWHYGVAGPGSGVKVCGNYCGPGWCSGSYIEERDCSDTMAPEQYYAYEGAIGPGCGRALPSAPLAGAGAWHTCSIGGVYHLPSRHWVTPTP